MVKPYPCYDRRRAFQRLQGKRQEETQKKWKTGLSRAKGSFMLSMLKTGAPAAAVLRTSAVLGTPAGAEEEAEDVRARLTNHKVRATAVHAANVDHPLCVGDAPDAPRHHPAQTQAFRLVLAGLGVSTIMKTQRGCGVGLKDANIESDSDSDVEGSAANARRTRRLCVRALHNMDYPPTRWP